ncbi:MAG: hypothetical protein MJ105_08780 [Lachnospiraceae bacterium]|nr:hypothetical protein [Lachnospiraceae bacterium]
MGFEGIYKAARVVKNVDEKGFVFVDIDTLMAETTDEGEKRMLMQTVRSMLRVDVEGNIQNIMEIPENTPAEEIEKAKSRGMSVTDDGKYLITKTERGKIEDGELYMYDETTFLAGTEWVKISTDVEDELNLVSVIYSKI